ncbi:hypothetical protein ACVNA9_004205 [Enterobacter hormaechei]
MQNGCRALRYAGATSTALRPRGEWRSCGLRLTPCLHCSPTAATARVRCAAILARSQSFSDVSRRSSRRSLAQYSLDNRSDRLSCFSALRPPVAPLHSPLFVGLSCRHGVSRNSDDIDYGGFL